MTKQQLIDKLEVVGDMSDQQIKTLVDILIDFFGSDQNEQIGFKKVRK